MLRTTSLLLLVAPIVAIAAPVPPPTEKELVARNWGKVIASSDKYEFKLNGPRLTMRSAGEPTHGVFHGAACNMPRVTRTAKGDFEATVKVVDAGIPNVNVKHVDVWPHVRAGLFVSGGGSAIEFHLFQYHNKINNVVDPNLRQCLWIDNWYPSGGNGNSITQVDLTKPLYLRITRKDKAATVSYSFDGKEWSVPYPTRKLDLPDEVTVGVFFSQSTYQITDATFEGFTIEKPK